MKPYTFVLFIAAPKALAALVDHSAIILDHADGGIVADCDEHDLHEVEYAPLRITPGVDCAEFDAFPSQDGHNSTESSFTSVKIGYGGHWNKGIKHWVAFPMLGLVACKQFVDLGRMSVGAKHGACQKSFNIANKWYQLYDCDPTTGMPKYLLDGEGVTIASCAAKTFKILCMKEGEIWGRGSCESPPPEELESLDEREYDKGEVD